jgi:serine/threonine protein kinase
MQDVQDLVGQTIGAYTVDDVLGQGGFAWVYRARDASGTAVALKVLKPRYGGDAAFEQRFRQEAEVAAGLDHPNIVRILDVGHAGRFSFFAMPVYPHSLLSLLEQRETIDEATAIRLARDVAAGLQYAHGAGLVHRDIKPANILIADDGTAVVADFGIARAVTSYVTATGANMTIGTPQYISPEQAQGRPMDGRADLYALGIALYRATTGQPPFRSTDWFELARMHVEETPPSIRAIQPQITARFERVVMRCLAKHPDDRYQSAEALAAELGEVTETGRSTKSFGMDAAGAGAVAAEHTSARWPFLVLSVVVVIAVAVAIVLAGR